MCGIQTGESTETKSRMVVAGDGEVGTRGTELWLCWVTKSRDLARLVLRWWQPGPRMLETVSCTGNGAWGACPCSRVHAVPSDPGLSVWFQDPCPCSASQTVVICKWLILLQVLT